MDISTTQLSSSILSHSVLLYEPATDNNGSGVLIQLGTKIFVLTAAHVVEEENVLISMGLPGQQEPFAILQKWSDSNLDIGYLELSPFEVHVRRGDNIRPYKISTQKAQQASSGQTTFILCGFPFSEVVRKENVRKPTPTLIWSALMHPSNWSEFLTQNCH